MRTCRKCGVDFSTHRCEPCHRASSAAYRAANTEKAKAYQVEYLQVEENKVKARQRALEYRLAKPEHVRLVKVAYAAANSRAAVERVNQWRKLNPNAKRIQSHNYRAKKRSTGRLSQGLADRLYKLQRGKCACCGLALGKDYHMDHVMPIALGGENVDANIQLLRQRCNNQKHAKHPITFMQERGFLL